MWGDRYLIGYLLDLMDGLNPEDQIVEWHHQLNGHEFERTPGDSEGQGTLVCCSPWGHKESDTTEWLNNKWMDCGEGISQCINTNIETSSHTSSL